MANIRFDDNHGVRLQGLQVQETREQVREAMLGVADDPMPLIDLTRMKNEKPVGPVVVNAAHVRTIT